MTEEISSNYHFSNMSNQGPSWLMILPNVSVADLSQLTN
jgi:diadenosine tetraphosphate (Ap4A) HIT family hydrolase